MFVFHCVFLDALRGGQMYVNVMKKPFFQWCVKLRSDSLTLFSNAEAKDCVDIEPQHFFVSDESSIKSVKSCRVAATECLFTADVRFPRSLSLPLAPSPSFFFFFCQQALLIRKKKPFTVK